MLILENLIKENISKTNSFISKNLVPSSKNFGNNILDKLKKNSRVIPLVVMASLTINSNSHCPDYFMDYERQKSELKSELLSRENEAINIWSYNLRADYLAEDDGEKYSWDNRRDLIVEELKDNAPDIICFQETTPNMFNYLVEELDGYTGNLQRRYEDNDKYFGQSIFYNKDRFEEIESGKFYLSETPDEFSIGFNKDVRICAWIKLYDKVTDKEFYVYNAHYTTHNNYIQKKSSELINERTKSLDAPVIFVGDFNCNLSSSAYRETDENFEDATRLAVSVIDYGQTYQAYNFLPRYAGQPIDFIWVSETNGIADFDVLSYERFDDFTEENFLNYLRGGMYAPSDHYAIGAKVFVKNNVDDNAKEME